VEWGLITIADPEQTKEPVTPLSQIKVLAFKEKSEWELVAKYNIGKR
jgi:hypothetical protein